MVPKLSHHDTSMLQDVVEIGGDLLLLPEQTPVPIEEARALEMAGVIEPSDSILYQGAFQTFEILRRYEHDRNARNAEPDWIHEMPISVRTRARLDYAIAHEDPLGIVPRLPHTGLSYMVREGGLCEDLARAFNLFRLQYIKQLGFLNAPSYNDYIAVRQSLSDHSRWLHSLDVTAIGTVVCSNLGIKDEMLNTARTLFLTHDALTPAGGDSVKMVDLVNLDEDDNYPELLGTKAVRSVMKKHGIRRDLLLKGIRNQGMLGQILDYADKIAYIARDLDKCRHHIEAGAYSDQLGMKSLLGLITRHPDACSLWDCVEIQEGQAVFTSISRLVLFLKVRLLMFRELYYHPTARFGEFLMSRLFVRALMQRGVLNKKKLLDMNDSQLMMTLDREFGVKVALDACSSQFSRCAEFKTLEEGEAFMQELRESGNVFAMLDDNRRNIKTGIDVLVYTKHGPQPLRDADPGSARELTEMATLLKLVHAHYLSEDPTLAPHILSKLREELST